MTSKFLPTAILTVLCLCACGSEADPPSPEQMAEFALCSKAALESDLKTTLELTGPGVDPATRALAPGDYLISATYLALRPGQERAAGEIAGPIVDQVFTMPGLVAVGTTSSASCATLRTLTVWKSERDMFGFVGSPLHAHAMTQISNLSRGTSNSISWSGDASSATFQEAARQLGLEATGDR